jgi:predicted TIM-barrel fold metal-dependent hydrolase
MGRYSDIERIAKKFPEAKIIVAHLGKYLCNDEALIEKFIELAATYKNVYLDASGVSLVHKIKEAVYKVGSDRVIFGTDGPHEEPSLVQFAKNEINKIRSLGLDRKDEEAIMGGNIAKLLRI